jgi:hypothetical protein
MEILPHYYFSWIVSFQKQRYTCEMFPLETKQSGDKLLPHSNLRGGVFLGEISSSRSHYRRCTCKIKCRIAMTKAAFNMKGTPFTSTLDLELRKKLVKCSVWSIALYGA